MRATSKPFEFCWWHNSFHLRKMQNFETISEYLKGVWEHFRATHQWRQKNIICYTLMLSIATVLKQIQMLMTDFFLGWNSDRKRYHWVSLKNLSFPYDEKGVGMRNVKNIWKAFQFKKWWNFRTKQTLWGNFVREKYCQRSNPTSKK